ncbi:MAG: sodium:proton antiporter [Deltaproteobacteria bacterium]|nr:sodium:proton antiporter [Candidatus Deferrimicrobiaceae bacterium]
MEPLDPIALGRSLPPWSVLPFAGFLLSIALIPLFAPSFWSRHYGKVSAAFGVPVAAWFLVSAPRELFHTALEYVSFLVLLGSLFTISGGILLRGTIRGTPGINCAFLGAGAVLSNFLGTTGASMLLIRPLLRANAHRKRAAHVYVFFIFVVANIGGLLTPIGDPPLFLGYLKGVPFFWTVKNLWHCWLAAGGIVIGIFYVMDRLALRSEAPGGHAAQADGNGKIPLSIAGGWNFLLLGVVIGAVFLPTPVRETVMTGAAILSAWKTPTRIREENEFTYHPMEEVAILFAGIFATMIPALLILKARGGELGVTQPWQFFWASGTLSSFLDNAPTYLTFLSLAQGLSGHGDVAGVSTPILRAISAGSVFMGANSYIGNAPNFMVKAIVEGAGVRMPSFFGYMAYSAAVLLPVFALVALLFL